MATGTLHQSGGVAVPTDVPYAGVSEWERLSGVTASSPLVGGTGSRADMPYDVDARTRIVSQDGPRLTEPMHGGPGVALLDDWRDLFNFRGSPVPWLLLLTLVIVGFMQLRVSARAGKAKGNIALG